MATTYVEADANTTATVMAVMELYHKRLSDIGLTVKVLFAHAPRDKNGDAIPPAIKIRGRGATSKIDITTLKGRSAGLADSVLFLDGDEWHVCANQEQQAIIDQRLTELDVVLDSEGAVKRDDLGRPKLKRRVADFAVEGFVEVAERHREHSEEVKAVQALGTQFVRQGLLAGF